MNIILDLFSFTSIVILILSIFQTIVGVGVLVLGTPILLLLGFEMLEVMTILLPLSILNSFLNILYFKFQKRKYVIDQVMKKYFFFICFPGVFLGLLFLKFFNQYINFNILVSLIIWLVLLASFLHKKNNLNPLFKIRKSVTFLTGFVHGVTNSGGSLLSILMIETYKKNVDYIRYQIIFFYFFLALFQYLSIILIHDFGFFRSLALPYILSLILGVIVGNLFSNNIDRNFLRIAIFIFAFISSVFLLLKA